MLSCREGLWEPPFLHPLLGFIAFSCNTDTTRPGAARRGNRPLLQARCSPFPMRQRKSVTGSGRFSQLPAPPYNYTSSVQKQEAAGAVSFPTYEAAAARCCGVECGRGAEDGPDIQLCIKHLPESKYTHRTQPVQNKAPFLSLHAGEKRLQSQPLLRCENQCFFCIYD